MDALKELEKLVNDGYIDVKKETIKPGDVLIFNVKTDDLTDMEFVEI